MEHLLKVGWVTKKQRRKIYVELLSPINTFYAIAGLTCIYTEDLGQGYTLCISVYMVKNMVEAQPKKRKKISKIKIIFTSVYLAMY